MPLFLKKLFLQRFLPLHHDQRLKRRNERNEATSPCTVRIAVEALCRLLPEDQVLQHPLPTVVADHPHHRMVTGEVMDRAEQERHEVEDNSPDEG